MIDCVLLLVSGSEIFATVDKVDGEMITFSDPMKIEKRYKDSNNGVSIQLNYEPFFNFNGNKHTFHRQHIISCEPLIPQLALLYADMKKTSSSVTSESPVIPGNITIH